MHESVLLQESVSALKIDAGGIYVDGTFGRGGHSSAILEQLGPDGILIAFDKDPSAIEFAALQFANDARLVLHHGSFAEIGEVVARLGKSGMVGGILLDLGVSSPQLDEPGRGFSFLRDGPLDMRMDTSRGESAAAWLNRAESHEIRDVLRKYGEENFAALIARNIVEVRGAKPFTTTLQLANLVSAVIPDRAKERGKHPATRTFQAIRIFINQELQDLECLLQKVSGILKEGGRLVVISFHSLEDRIVKQFIRGEEQGPRLPRNIPITTIARGPHLVSVGKAVRASAEEVERNARSRSAIMRIAEKVAA
jgi:16S rRNA (cytosine1402-N4)-methyltransferase